MLSAQLTLDGATGTETTWNLISQDKEGSTRVLSGSVLGQESYLFIRHTRSGTGKNLVAKDNVTVQINKDDSNGLPRRGSVSISLVRPAGGVTDADIKDALAYLIDLLSDGGFSGTGFAGTTNLSDFMQGGS